MKKQRLAGLILSLCLILALAGTAWGKEGMKEVLENLSGVEGALELEVEEGDFFQEKYLLTFSLPLDWKNPQKGCFPLRVELGRKEGAIANIMETDGYLLYEEQLKVQDGHELCSQLNASYIHIEHRFFGGSVPEGLSNDSVEYWEYLNDENAAADFHAVYEALSQVLEGPWIGTGSSRGGLVCESYAMWYPKDMVGYVIYVAPCSQGLDDPRMFPFVYESIGDKAYGEELAGQYRRLVEDLQVELMRHKEVLAASLWEYSMCQGLRYREAMTPQILFDLCVLESAVTFWQYYQTFDELESLLSMPEEDEKLSALLGALIRYGRPQDWSVDQDLFRYFINMASEYGQYHYDFSYLRSALKASGLEDRLTIGEEEEEGLLRRILLTPDQQDILAYRGDFYDRILHWIDTTTSPLVMIYGGSDPWYSQRIRDTRNPAVHDFVLWEGNHLVRILNFDAKEREKILDVMKRWLAPEKLRPRVMMRGWEKKERKRKR